MSVDRVMWFVCRLGFAGKGIPHAIIQDEQNHSKHTEVCRILLLARSCKDLILLRLEGRLKSGISLQISPAMAFTHLANVVIKVLPAFNEYFECHYWRRRALIYGYQG